MSRISQLNRLVAVLEEALGSSDPAAIAAELAAAKTELEADPKFSDLTLFMSFTNWAELEGEAGAQTLLGVLKALAQQWHGVSFLGAL